MQVEARSFGEPGADLRVLVSGVVVDHKVKIEVARDIGFDVLQEPQEFLMSTGWRRDARSCGSRRRTARIPARSPTYGPKKSSA